MIYAVLVVYVIWGIIYWGYNSEFRWLYISQMKDRGIYGHLIVAITAILILLASIEALVNKLKISLVIQLAAFALMIGILLTQSTSKIHDMMFLVLVVICLGIVITTIVQLISSSLNIMGILLLLVFMITVCKDGILDPSWQKTALIIFILVESINVYVCYPMKLSINPVTVKVKSPRYYKHNRRKINKRG